MTINEYLDIALDGVNNFLDPAVNYRGVFQFNYKALREASKISNNRNLLDDYFTTYYFDKVYRMFPNFKDIPLIFSNYHKEDGYGRRLIIDTNDVVNSLFSQISGFWAEVSDDRTDEENRRVIRDTIRTYLKQARDCLNNGNDSEYYDMFYQRYLEYYQNTSIKLPFNQYMQSIVTILCDKFLPNLNAFYNTFNKDIDINKIRTMVDLEKFDFIMAHQLLMMSQATDSVLNMYHKSLTSVYRYIEAIDMYMEQVDPSYKISMNSYDIVGRQIPNYNYGNLKRTFNELVTKYPQFQIINLRRGNINFDTRDANAIEDYKERISKILEDSTLSASWEILPQGDSDREYLGRKKSSSVPTLEDLEAKLSKGQQRLVDCKMFLDGTDYLKTVRGINNFDGYIGYIYGSGLVVFEKFYKKYETRIPVDEAATYVMTFDNFVEMSKRTKTEIMDYIKDNGEDVRRIYHGKEWREKVNTVIEIGDLTILDHWKEQRVLKKTKKSNED